MLASTTNSPDWLPKTVAHPGAELPNDALSAVHLAIMGWCPRTMHGGSLSGYRDSAFDIWVWVMEREVVHRIHSTSEYWSTESAIPLGPMFSAAAHVSAFGERPLSRLSTASDSVRVLEAYPHEYGDRIEELQAAADEEGITPNSRSLDHFIQFVHGAGFPLRMGSLFLLDDGTYSAVWRNDQWRLNLNFRSGSIDYVVLDRLADQPKGETGTVDLAGFANLISEFGLESLLRA